MSVQKSGLSYDEEICRHVTEEKMLQRQQKYETHTRSRREMCNNNSSRATVLNWCRLVICVCVFGISFQHIFNIKHSARVCRPHDARGARGAMAPLLFSKANKVPSSSAKNVFDKFLI